MKEVIGVLSSLKGCSICGGQKKRRGYFVCADCLKVQNKVVGCSICGEDRQRRGRFICDICRGDLLFIKYLSGSDYLGRSTFLLYWPVVYVPGHPEGDTALHCRKQVFFRDPEGQGFPKPEDVTQADRYRVL